MSDGTMHQFPLLTPKVICDNKLKSRQGQCPLSLALIQDTSCHEILQNLIDAPPKLLDGLSCESKEENNGRRRNWDALPGSQHFKGKGPY